MKLAYWMYAGPAHIGVLRVSSSFKNVHAIMHAPLGDDYFNVMRSMLERERDFTPVTASIVDRHVLARGSQEKVVENITRKNKEESPDLILLTPTCTSSILQEDLHNFVERSTLSLTSLENTIDKTKKKSSFSPVKKAAQKKDNIYMSESQSPDGERVLVKNKAVTSEIKQKNNEGPLFVMSPSKENLSPNGHPQKGCSDEYLRSEAGIDQSEGLMDGASLRDTPSEDQPDVILADVNHYRVNELQAADRTLEQIVRYYIEKAKKQNNLKTIKTEKPSVNIIGIFTLGFHNQHDCRELKRLFNDLGIKINEIIPEGGNVHNLKNLPQAWFNFVPYREVGLMTAVYLKSEFNMPYVSITPIGLVDTALCIRNICKIITTILLETSTKKGETNNFEYEFSPVSKLGVTSKKNLALEDIYIQNDKLAKSHMDSNGKLRILPQHQLTEAVTQIENLFNKYIDQQTRFVSQAAWFSRSIDCQNLTGKKAVVFGDATHAAAMTKILAREMGIRVSCAGTYCKHDADWFREQVNGFCDQILITDDHTQVGDTIAKLEPAAIFGTQMERHVGKRLDIPCGVISAPVHIQNFPLGYRPFLGYEGTNQIADLVYNSFNLGMEDHLLQIFGGHDSVLTTEESKPHSTKGEGHTDINKTNSVNSQAIKTKTELNLWSPEGLAELNKVPGFVRGKVKRNTEKYALEKNIPIITVEVMYAAKEALSN
uniref:Light-independent protochlorophyllide reductase subunit B n=1 Tax=Gonium pectorale TaxID=33097 RepID=M1VHE2_GONPE|nr:photochlorophyllide reductase subunit B [Gonium pectorale]BAM85964.1 photochlorophyllide reductase subunit B [Gonium pectorale]